VSIHNLRFFSRFMEQVRAAISDGTLERKAAGWIDEMYAEEERS
jgi:queuine/archaeosine tRNA-ribosyltransferase